jgi:hypothetical protein
MEAQAEKLLERNRVGALMRIFATTSEEVEMQTGSAMTALHKLLTHKTGDHNSFARIDFLVSSDPNFEDSDCGETATILRNRIQSELPGAPVNVFEIKKGDIYAMLLNYGVAIQLEDRIPYSLILSHREHAHITSDNIHALLAAMHNKARVAGLILPEVAETVRKGRIANTFAIWHNKSLVTVGGFDLRAGKPMIHEANKTKIFTSVNTQFVERSGHETLTFHAAGCEEIIPLLRFNKFFGPSIRLVTPENPESIPALGNIFTDKSYRRHHAKLATKDARQAYMAEIAGFDIDELRTALM